MTRRSYRQTLVSVTMALLVSVSISGCEWFKTDDQVCRDVLDIVCGCPSVNCNAEPPLPIVQRLRDCDSMRTIAECIKRSTGYCTVLSALVTQSSSLCSMDCTYENICDEEDACHAYQYNQCSLPTDAGGPDAR